MASEIMMTLMNLSNQWNRPKTRMTLQNKVMMTLQMTISSVMPKSLEANPAVTTVTALWIFKQVDE